MGLFIFINIILVTYNFLILKQKRNEYQKLIQEHLLSEPRQFNQNISDDFYDSPCPDIILNSISGEKIELRNLAGNVILIRFSRFYRQDLSNLVYLQHLADKYKNQGLSLIFINSLGKHDTEEIDKIISLVSPIIEDNGSIAAQFNAFQEDFFIIDRGFNIKFKYHLATKTLLYNEAIKWIFEKQPLPNPVNDVELANSIHNLVFYDVFKNIKRKVSEVRNKNIFLTVFTSICTGCEESNRIDQLKIFSKSINVNEVEIIILYGKGNNIEAIKQYAVLNDWDDFLITIGVVDFNGMTEKNYYQIFQLETDPKTIILDSLGAINFVEIRRTSKLINLDFLEKHLK